jgi:hypothetical protein
MRGWLKRLNKKMHGRAFFVDARVADRYLRLTAMMPTKTRKTTMEYEAWLKTVPNRSLCALWARYAAPSEDTWETSYEVQRAWLIHCEMQDRGLLAGHWAEG